MALLGEAALAMWWDMAADARADFEHWHAHEHFPERLGIPGFRRASRWRAADGGEGVFVLYELADYGVLSSPAYLARLNAPTPWSTRMMPHHRHMVRSQCRVLESRGASTARHALTVRLSPAAGRDEALRAGLRALAETLVQRPGLVGLHLLRHATPPIAQTEEQKIRGLNDRVADWVLVACGYELEAVQALAELEEAALCALGAAPGTERGVYTLAYTATPADMN
ncbi:hypothetical protein [Pseudorhodoferax sp. Leaf267]|uniref:hypothetical protein n=1 Tax=Pseudorhodoferax sp. Leaf267 TaxID=1736316 RepID=UPI0006F9A391|nr:hypothetical protein [Pseudorhodoferax sp. Leaf267]KQP18401.1 hypothetical protein ASF43_11380 [Pseudorhodoferax sp. Leaf267]